MWPATAISIAGYLVHWPAAGRCVLKARTSALAAMAAAGDVLAPASPVARAAARMAAHRQSAEDGIQHLVVGRRGGPPCHGGREVESASAAAPLASVAIPAAAASLAFSRLLQTPPALGFFFLSPLFLQALGPRALLFLQPALSLLLGLGDSKLQLLVGEAPAPLGIDGLLALVLGLVVKCELASGVLLELLDPSGLGLAFRECPIASVERHPQVILRQVGRALGTD
mmetsp:Transcript_26775/g.77325  ORF Transcript_26775/g.77325 Transcript_26775/m.77325 type:complete len:227 (-) Transcript_26775:636-1316(-)